MTKRSATNLIYFVSMLLIVIVRIMFAAGTFSGLSEYQTDMVFSVLVQVLSVGIVPFLLYSVYLKRQGENRPVKKMLAEFGYTKNISLKGWLLVLVISLLSTYLITTFSSAWYTILTAIGYKRNISAAGGYSVGILFLEFLFTATLPAVFEEFSNRGVLYNGNKNGRKPFRVIFITAALFALMHTNITQLGYTFICGVIAGALVFYTRSIWTAMLYHFTNNFISVTRDYGRANGGFLDGLNTMYNWLLGTKAGIITGTFIFIIIAFVIFILIMKLAADETERNIKRDANYGDTYVAQKIGKWDNLMLYAAVSMNAAVTVYTLVWGIMR